MMKYSYGPFNPFKSTGLLIAVGTFFALVIAGTAVGLGLGIGLHNDDGNLTVVTTTNASTTVATTTLSSESEMSKSTRLLLFDFFSDDINSTIHISRISIE